MIAHRSRLFIDLQPAHAADPNGIDGVIWKETPGRNTVPRPMTADAVPHEAATAARAYIEPPARVARRCPCRFTWSRVDTCLCRWKKRTRRPSPPCRAIGGRHWKRSDHTDWSRARKRAAASRTTLSFATPRRLSAIGDFPDPNLARACHARASPGRCGWCGALSPHWPAVEDRVLRRTVNLCNQYHLLFMDFPCIPVGVLAICGQDWPLSLFFRQIHPSNKDFKSSRAGCIGLRDPENSMS